MDTLNRRTFLYPIYIWYFELRAVRRFQYISQRYLLSSKKKIEYLDEIRPWITTWMIEAKVIHTWKPSQAGFGETLEIILADKKVYMAIFFPVYYLFTRILLLIKLFFIFYQGIKVHATCRKDYLRYLGIQCIVGEWKTLILRFFFLNRWLNFVF